MNTTTINLDQAPKWDFTLRIRDVDLVLRSPLDIGEDMSSSPVPTQSELDEQFKRWPGIFPWIWRAIVGGPRLKVSALPTDGGAGHTRQVVLVIVGDHHQAFVDGLSTGELVQIVQGYTRCQQQWAAAVHNYAAVQAQEQYQSVMPGPTSHNASAGEQLVPGGPLPIMLDPKHNRLVRDNRASQNGVKK